jgi:hypothetical protein
MINRVNVQDYSFTDFDGVWYGEDCKRKTTIRGSLLGAEVKVRRVERQTITRSRFFDNIYLY